MRLRITLYDVLEQTETFTEVEADPHESLAELTGKIGFTSAEIGSEAAFPVWDAYSANGTILPFVETKDGVKWEVVYSDLTVADALRTLRIRDNTVRFNVGIPQAGGPDLVDVAVLWQEFYAAIRAVDPVVGVGGAAATLAAFVRRVLRRRRAAEPPPALASIPPGAVFSLVAREEHWDPWTLAATAGITREDAVHLLRLCRFRWDPSSRSYRRTTDTDRIVAALNNVRQYDE